MLYSTQLTSCRARTMYSNTRTFEKLPCCVGVRSGVLELHGHSFPLWQRRNTSVVGFTLSELVFLPHEQKTCSSERGPSAFMQINCTLGNRNQKMNVNKYEHINERKQIRTRKSHRKIYSLGPYWLYINYQLDALIIIYS